MLKGFYRRILRALHVRQLLCDHHFWPYIADDGLSNYEKCGKCGLKITKGARHVNALR